MSTVAVTLALPARSSGTTSRESPLPLRSQTSTGNDALLPASMQGEIALRLRSAHVAVANCGSSALFPVPAQPPKILLKVIAE